MAAILDCRLIHGILWVTSRNVFECLPREELSSAFFENSQNLASSSCGLGLGVARIISYDENGYFYEWEEGQTVNLINN